jgi:hypothetical protein
MILVPGRARLLNPECGAELVHGEVHAEASTFAEPAGRSSGSTSHRSTSASRRTLKSEAATGSERGKQRAP